MLVRNDTGLPVLVLEDMPNIYIVEAGSTNTLYHPTPKIVYPGTDVEQALKKLTVGTIVVEYSSGRIDLPRLHL